VVIFAEFSGSNFGVTLKNSEEADKILAKAVNFKRISKDECIKLLKFACPSELFYTANYIREKLFGNKTTFSVNRHINYSNICENRCLFCAFRKEDGSKEAKRLTIESILNDIEKMRDLPNLEIHITGGLDSQFSLKDALNLVKGIKEIKGDAIIKAFTMVEIDFFSRTSGISDFDVIKKLKEAGVSAFPGGGAEIFSEEIRKRISPRKIDGQRWLALSKTAHKLGVPSNATMLYGIGETEEEIADHLDRLRTLQDETKGFMSFIPLLFQKENTPLHTLKELSLIKQLKIYAVSRIFLDNIGHIKNHWVMSGLKSAELSQWCGVDDLEGTVVEERIGHEGGAKTPIGMTKDEIVRLIKSAGRIPVERDGLYRKTKKGDGKTVPEHKGKGE